MKLIMNREECREDLEAHDWVGDIRTRMELESPGECAGCSEKLTTPDAPHVHGAVIRGEFRDRMPIYCSEGCAIKAQEEVHAG